MAFAPFDSARAKQYPAFTLHPFAHKQEQMKWASASVVPIDQLKNLIFLSGGTGRDPETDRQPTNFEEERQGVGKVVGGPYEQTVATWSRIKEVIEGLGCVMEDIVFIRWYVAHRNDWWDVFDATHEFWREHCPDLVENPRANTLLKEVKLDLPEMRIEIEVIVAEPKSRS